MQGLKLVHILSVESWVQVMIGYVIPMLLLYMWEMRERHEFAKSKRLDVADLRTCFAESNPVIARELASTLLIGAYFFTAS
jgi:hypothetical protein